MSTTLSKFDHDPVGSSSIGTLKRGEFACSASVVLRKNDHLPVSALSLPLIPIPPSILYPATLVQQYFKGRASRIHLTALLGEAKYAEYLAAVIVRPHVTSPEVLSRAQEVAIWAYTSPDGWHERINSELWDGTVSSVVAAFAGLINRGLGKLFQYPGTVYRGYADSNIEEFLDAYKVGNVKTFPAFTSTSKEMNEAFFGNVLFIVVSHHGAEVEKFSALPEEREVTFQTGSRFRVAAVERVGDSAVIQLDEVHS